ncbi:type I-G CRISPR-associated RAMP protein Csb1/Cas7g [Spongiactinospora gelatinilytica]|uniref:type I-G CRISPR-associated RAMP protein Csb1/Cas7g n=1 Tax=Spongiactinospora gelatinilytica TaxID=2666298 RepID=UPI001F22C28C|nr:type I-U CRISPR-associated RAMP protein Csb1/Cas7u [Spongiactinospora gelatinilytica]
MSTDLAARLLQAVGPDRAHTALVVKALYQPVGGAGNGLMPPTFPVDKNERDLTKKYLVGERLVDGERQVTVTVDQEQSQANRVEEALRDARDGGRIELPAFEMRLATAHGEVRITSFDAPHRYADAYWRDSTIGGVAFDKSEVGRRLRSVSAADARPLFEREPASLIYGAWDSHRKGRWPKFARLYTAIMYGLDPVFGVRRGGRLDPVNLTGAIDDKNKAENGWGYIAEGTKKAGQKLSEIGHGNIAPNPVPGGVSVREVRRVASVSLAGLERLRFGDAPAEAATSARATLLALALAGDRLAFARPSVWLRSGCDLAQASEEVGLELPGGELEPLEVSAADALGAFHELRVRTAKLGIEMASDVISVAPVKSLRDAIESTVANASTDGE